MADGSFSERWSNYRPSKAIWFWSCAGCMAATLIIGFTWGGWVTGGTAHSMASKAAANGRTNLAAALCVNKFVASSDASTTFTKLKDASSWNRGDIISEGGWAKIRGIEDSPSGVADACAERIAGMDTLPAPEGIGTTTAASEGNG